MQTAPIALFVYNRPEHTRRTIEALLRNDLAAQSNLFIFSDASKSTPSAAAVDDVRAYITSIKGFKSVTINKRTQNIGLAASIIDGVTSICREHGRVIVLEDDMVTSRWFLKYMNEGLTAYADEELVASIHAYWFPIRVRLPETFFLRGADCWGWGTWERAWRNFEPEGGKLLQALLDRKLNNSFDLDGSYGFTQMLRDQITGLNDSWAVRWHAACFLKGLFTLYPGRSLVDNIGNDASGTHLGETEYYSGALASEPILLEKMAHIAQCEEARDAFKSHLRGARKSLLQRILARIRQLARLR